MGGQYCSWWLCSPGGDAMLDAGTAAEAPDADVSFDAGDTDVDGDTHGDTGSDTGLDTGFDTGLSSSDHLPLSVDGDLFCPAPAEK